MALTQFSVAAPLPDILPPVNREPSDGCRSVACGKFHGLQAIVKDFHSHQGSPGIKLRLSLVPCRDRYTAVPAECTRNASLLSARLN